MKILLIILILILLWVAYKVITQYYYETFVAIDQGSLNDCLTTCSQDHKCIAATYNPSTNECILSQTFGELGGINSYAKKDNFHSDVFIDQDYNEYNVLKTANARIVDWSLDKTKRIPYTFEEDRGNFTINRIFENVKHRSDDDFGIDVPTGEKYRFEDDDDFLSI